MTNFQQLSQGRILVTGGAGFIGSALIWALNRMGCENILVVDVLDSSEKWKNLPPLRFADYWEADDLLRAVESDDPALLPVTTVFHLGACSSTTERDGRYLIENNYQFTKLLCRWAMRRQVRFVYASSAATYGDGTHGMQDDDSRLEQLRPLNLYGYSKHLFDLHARREGWLERIVGLKYFNVFGPNEAHKGEMRSVVHKAYGQIRQTGQVSLFKSHHPDYPDGGQQRDFLYVKDAVAMTIHLATTPGCHGLYNLGSGRAHTWLELVTPIFTALGQTPRIEFIEMPEHLRAKYQYFTQAEITRLRASGYDREITDLGEAVTDYVQNYLVKGRSLGDE